MTIQLLPDHVVNQISAGEVVERPVSVVRELIDNALDAGANEISIRIEEGGQSLVLVEDNGSGMSPDELKLAVRRHATSKLRDLSDLDNLTTLGFRGEALPSIASVSKLSITTRPQSAELAAEIRIEGGEVLHAGLCAGRVGTTVEVRQLFFNTPARRKFLKSVRGDELKIRQWIEQTALIRPQVRFRIKSGEKEILSLPPRDSYVERAKGMFGADTVPVSYQVGPLKISGLVRHPGMASSDSKALLLFVNGRLVNDRALVRAVRDGFDSTLKNFEYPAGTLSLEIPGEFVDVNVHPQKSEVRFRNGQAVFGAVRSAVKAAVQEFKRPVAFQSPQYQSAAGAPLLRIVPGNQVNLQLAEQPAFGFSSGAEISRGAASPAFRFSDLKYLGQLLGCYLLCEKAEEFYVVDMHAAHERLNFNRIRNAFAARGLPSQALLEAQEMDLPEEILEGVKEYLDLLEAFGFAVELGQGARLRIKAVPTIFANQNLSEFLTTVFRDQTLLDAESAMQRRVDALAASLACHASVRSGDALSRSEVYELFSDLDKS